jgi:hypothetical protein
MFCIFQLKNPKAMFIGCFQRNHSYILHDWHSRWHLATWLLWLLSLSTRRVGSGGVAGGGGSGKSPWRQASGMLLWDYLDYINGTGKPHLSMSVCVCGSILNKRKKTKTKRKNRAEDKWLSCFASWLWLLCNQLPQAPASVNSSPRWTWPSN